jgi:hypothetical protein
MSSPHQIMIAFLAVFLAGNSVFAGPTAAGTLEVAATSEPPGPGCPSIPGGPGPLPDDEDDDDGVAFSA